MTSFQRLITILLYFVSLSYGGIFCITHTFAHDAFESHVLDDIGKSEKIISDTLSCPAKNSKFPVHLPHPDCNKFYICDNGTPHLKECQEGLHFNPKIKTCDFPENSGCDTGDLRKPKDRIIGDDSGICPTEKTRLPVHVPHESECSKFYICDNGTPHLKECHPGLHFNSKIKTCDFPENAGCDKDYKNKIGGRMVDHDADACPMKNSSRFTFIPHPTDCNSFFICQNGKKILLSCPPGLHFNLKKGICDFPHNAECDENYKNKIGGRMVDHDADVCPMKNSSRFTFITHPTDCNFFFICQNGKKILLRCPTGLHFNLKKGICDFPHNVECEGNMTEPMAGVPSPFCPSINGKIPIFFRHPTNCSVFYMCGNGLAYEFVCPAKLHFNVRKRLCDYESNSNCRVNS